MLSLSDFPITEAMRHFSRFGAEAAYLVPTSTGLGKSILDAHQSFRSFLASKGIHNYDEQSVGPLNKETRQVYVIGTQDCSLRNMSLYRPTTKSGDPRVWISGLREFAEPNNLIAVLCSPDKKIYIVNVSDARVWSTVEIEGSPLQTALLEFSSIEAATSILLSRLRDISKQGFVASQRSGDTGVGFTLESLLGIRANSSKDPDFQGIEIKAGRTAAGSLSKHSRTSLFSQVPEWRSSPCRTATELLEKVGYVDRVTGRKQLYCTNSVRPNPQGLLLELTDSDEWLESRHLDSYGSKQTLVRWNMNMLRGRLSAKHASTFWVSAESRQGRDGEEFRYTSVTHTRHPLVWNLGPAIQAGKVTLDFTLSQKPTGLTRDHGYLFKLHERSIDFLFPPSETYSL
jgi:hypothetical protein